RAQDPLLLARNIVTEHAIADEGAVAVPPNADPRILRPVIDGELAVDSLEDLVESCRAPAVGQARRCRLAHARFPSRSSRTSPTSSAMRASFVRMLSTSSAGGRCSSRSGARGFLRSRFKP